MKKLSKILCLMLALCLCIAMISGCAVSFEGKVLKSGRVGEYYSDTIAGGGDLFYNLDEDSHLPAGLTLMGDGRIYGYPMEAGEFNFKAVAIDTNNEAISADFVLNIEGAQLSYTASALPNAKTNEAYSQDIGTATGMLTITYSLKEGSALPAGLSLSDDGILSGIPTQATEQASFTVVASANGCDPVEATFTLIVEQGIIIDETLGYIVFNESFIMPDGLVGEPYSVNLIGSAYGVPGITYTIRYLNGSGLPAGVSYDSDLFLFSGTPTDSANGEITVMITASAEGYESVRKTFTFNILDKEVQTNRFEGEYVNLTGKKGAGYSSAPGGTGLIQKTPAASDGFFLGYLNCAIDFEFVINAEQATSATLVLNLGSEVGNFTYDKEMFSIIINGEELDYVPFNVTQIGTGEADFGFTAITVGTVNLQQGENTITFEIHESDKATGTYTAVGCLFDYMELIGCTGLSWRPKMGNVNGK